MTDPDGLGGATPPLPDTERAPPSSTTSTTGRSTGHADVIPLHGPEGAVRHRGLAALFADMDALGRGEPIRGPRRLEGPALKHRTPTAGQQEASPGPPHGAPTITGHTGTTDPGVIAANPGSAGVHRTAPGPETNDSSDETMAEGVHESESPAVGGRRSRTDPIAKRKRRDRA
jgi:hypothetical protein